ncbi:MAG: hypothetical protein WD294_15070 [Phycisphaeraceae bacterium]
MATRTDQQSGGLTVVIVAASLCVLVIVALMLVNCESSPTPEAADEPATTAPDAPSPEAPADDTDETEIVENQPQQPEAAAEEGDSESHAADTATGEGEQFSGEESTTDFGGPDSQSNGGASMTNGTPGSLGDESNGTPRYAESAQVVVEDQDDRIYGVIPPQPTRNSVTTGSKHGPGNARRRLQNAIIGEWEQSDDHRSPDLFEGGYHKRRVWFTARGTMVVESQFGADGDFVLTRQVDYTVLDSKTLLLGKESASRSDSSSRQLLTPFAARGMSVTIEPPVAKPPLEVFADVEGDSLRIGDKHYRRVPAD